MRVRAGFTMIELMIVLVILAILAAVAVPVYQSLVRRSKSAELTTAAGAIKNAVEVFRAQSGDTGFSGTAPSIETLQDQDLIGEDDFSGMRYFEGDNFDQSDAITIAYQESTADQGEGIRIELNDAVISDDLPFSKFILYPDGTTETTKK